MRVIGLTGSIGSGKSTIARHLRAQHIPVHDADAEVRGLQQAGSLAMQDIAKSFPGCVEDGVLNREALRRVLFADPSAWARLEAILHPKVRAAQTAFLRRCQRQRQPLAVLEAPLLFESGGVQLCDLVLVTSAPIAVRRARVLLRPFMSLSRFEDICARQWPDRKKAAAADFVIQTGLSRAHSHRQLTRILTWLRVSGHRELHSQFPSEYKNSCYSLLSCDEICQAA